MPDIVVVPPAPEPGNGDEDGTPTGRTASRSPRLDSRDELAARYPSSALSTPPRVPLHFFDVVAAGDVWKYVIEARHHTEALAAHPSDPGSYYDNDQSPGYRAAMLHTFNAVFNREEPLHLGWNTYDDLHAQVTTGLRGDFERNGVGTSMGRFPLSTIRPAPDILDEVIGGRRLMASYDEVRARIDAGEDIGALTVYQRHVTGKTYVYTLYDSAETPALINEVFARTRTELSSATTDIERMIAIGRTVRTLHVLHPYADGNGRLNLYVLLPELLLRHGFHPVISDNLHLLFNGGYTVHQIADVLLRGQPQIAGVSSRPRTMGRGDVEPLVLRTDLGSGVVRRGFSTKTPYEPQQDLRTYEQPPPGFIPVFTQSVFRHGSRAMGNSKYGEQILRLWDLAAGEGALTRDGEAFGPQVRSLVGAMAGIGYGNLSGRGRQEQRGAAVRLRERLPELFGTIAAGSERIEVVNSGKGRAVESGNVFAAALAASDPTLKPLIGPARTDPDLLYFHKTAGGADYRAYLTGDERLAARLREIQEQPAIRDAARGILLKIFTPSFVDRIFAGEFSSIGVRTGFDAARATYELYSITPAMGAEGTWQLERYVSAEEVSWFSHLADANAFYRKGPGFADSDITYKMANVLLDDFFAQIEARRAGSSDVGAMLRFAHAEIIIPFAVLLGLPGSERPGRLAPPGTDADGAWRGELVSPMAANVQWDVFQRGGTFLVRMLYNEKEVAFPKGVEPVSENSRFYDVEELRRYYGRTGRKPATTTAEEPALTEPALAEPALEVTAQPEPPARATAVTAQDHDDPQILPAPALTGESIVGGSPAGTAGGSGSAADAGGVDGSGLT
ncbi:histidine-type phosphatase, partial [Actinoallomurus iriomotensis]|uniref:histidine-type phosphatase n=1 Tax=Actinoallomurus iriomotensis TaxID=478107 RepID=UPI002553BEBF